MWVSLSLEVFGCWTTTANGAEVTSRVYKAVNLIEKTPESQLQRGCSFYCSGDKVYTGSHGYGREKQIGYDTTPNHHMSGRKEQDLCAESYNICREL